MVNWFYVMIPNIIGGVIIFQSINHRRKVEKTILKIGMQSFVASIKSKKNSKNNLPYKFVEVYGAEADDIIVLLVQNILNEDYDISGDKDFIQLQKYPNVKQYSPIPRKLMNGLIQMISKEHILRGDH